MARGRGGALDALPHRRPPGAWEQFVLEPCVFLARKLYTWQKTTLISGPPPPPADPVSVVCISDTHNTQPALPAGDILVHAGDLTQSGSFAELQAALRWLAAQPHPVKIVVGGNHDDAAATVVCARNGRRLRVHGSPGSPRNGDSWAFQHARTDGEEVWTGIDTDTDIDILVTHAPPRAHLDLVHLGCAHLLALLWRVRSRLHVFGHVHAGAGTEALCFDALQAAYERTVLARGGVGNLVCTVVAAVAAWWVFCGFGFGRRQAREATTLLVNAAMVGGLRDDELRSAVRVVV
ncbi:Metallo-dependent phosphatase-like protein [Lasiosphaeria miniovina]|uniref:Metallo-dependent phosphatase-like protein n=1 Tax=Lasiosphaeria miniovina TaxID=1954250 RepID=A0AA40E9G1_9PEZI|nr:Metallo-dependent phosphatase-like protein [Lasiosphaeria miniovina]KAK0733264.1 Metallo-dependent phosphatase-like protein [Lasiosphaeria miniovina]